MANRSDIKRRIGSVEGTKKITNAMKLVAASKFAKAVQAVVSSRPFSSSFKKMFDELIHHNTEDISSPFLRQVDKEKKVILIVVSTDKGLCGSINTNLFKFARSWIDEKRKENITVDLMTWGKKATSFFSKRKENVLSSKEGILNKIDYTNASSYIQEFSNLFIDETAGYDGVYICFTEFRSALYQVPKLIKLLPFSFDETSSPKEGELNRIGKYKVEPLLSTMIDTLILKKLAVEVLQVLLEVFASEQGSKMTSMDNATNNATELLKKLVLQYNRARQGAITTELIEIVAGSQAL